MNACKPPREAKVLLDHVNRFPATVLGPEDKAAEVHIVRQPFRMSILTTAGVAVSIVAQPGTN
jgi:hypothetical protein